MVTKLREFESPAIQERDDERVAEIRSLIELIPIEFVEIGHLAPSLPSELLLGTLHDGRLRVHSPIAVKLMAEDEDIIAQAVDFNEFGFGKNLSEALGDLQRAIVELYFTLEEEQARLGKDLQTIWANLQQKIERR